MKSSSVFGAFKFTENHPETEKKKVEFAIDENEESESESSIRGRKERKQLQSVKKTIKSRSQVLREDRSSSILAPIIRNWTGKPSPLDKVKASVKRMTEAKAKKSLASTRQHSEKPEHFWDEGNFKNTEEATFTGLR